jgi:integrase
LKQTTPLDLRQSLLDDLAALAAGKITPAEADAKVRAARDLMRKDARDVTLGSVKARKRKPGVALTAKKLARLTTPGRYRDRQCSGLLLQVKSAKNRSWVFRFERNGRAYDMGLGPAHTVGLSLAREKARAARLQLLDGVNPLQARRSARLAEAAATARAISFGEAAAAYYKAHSKGWSLKHAAQWRQSVLGDTRDPERDYCRILRPLPIAEIDTAMVLKVIEPLWQTTPETGARVRARIEATLAWGTVRGFRNGPNPAQWRNHLDKILPAKSKVVKPTHYEAMPFDDVPAFFQALAARSGIASQALMFLILTVARSREVREARWSEIDLAKAVWAVPAERMKAGKEHRVPLVPVAIDLLRALPCEEGNDLVFLGPQRDKPMSDMAFIALMRRMGETATPHGFRSAFSDWSNETTAYTMLTIEAALAHATGSKTEKAYRRGDQFEKRRKLMEAWSTHVTTSPAAAAEIGATVTAIGSAR